MKLRLWVLFALMPFATVTADDEAVKKDLAAFQGEWKILWIERDGLKIDAETRQKETGKPFSIWTIRGNKSWVGETLVHTFVLDPAYDPKIVDFLHEDEEPKTEAIYKLDGDTMFWCLNTNDGVPQRPLDFRAEKGSGRLVYAFVRNK